jgi:cyanophycinase
MKKIKLTLIFFFIPFFVYNTKAYSSTEKVEHSAFSLFLAGGGLKTCSSMSPKNCAKKSFYNSALEKISYQFSRENLQKLRATEAFITLDEEKRKNIDSVLVHIYSKLPNLVVDRTGLRELFELAGALTLYRELPDDLYYALLDSLEYRQLDPQGNRVKEQVDLLATNNPSSIEIYQEFVKQAAMRMSELQKIPKIAVVTASSRDPFESADFYQSVFTEAGAQVIWLPLDKTYRQAQELSDLGFNGCGQLSQLRSKNHSFYRSHIYPERVAKQQEYCLQPNLMLNDIAKVQGIFFNGGDQSLTLAAVKNSDGTDSRELALIRQRMSSGDLIVGGTSAGTAVQAGGQFSGFPITMISNGHSKNAMKRGAFAAIPPSQRCESNLYCGQSLLADDLTYKGSGGTGLFTLGMLDTHFSERDRETRLATFVAETRQRFGFGVDETTALLSKYDPENRQTQLKVIGRNGVYIVDLAAGKLSRSNQPDKSTLSGNSHYLNADSRAVYQHDNGQWDFAVAGQVVKQRIKLSPLNEGEWRDRTRKNCGANKAISWTQFDNEYSLDINKDTQFFHNQGKEHCSYINLPFVIKN